MNIYIDCRRFESNKHNTKVTVYCGDSIIAEKFLRRMQLGVISIPQHNINSLKFHFEIVSRVDVENSKLIAFIPINDGIIENK